MRNKRLSQSPKMQSSRIDRSGGVRLVLLLAMVMATVATEVMAGSLSTSSAGLFAYSFPLLNLGTGIVTILLMAIAAAKATATTYYVRTTGNDSNSGTSPADAWASFTEALDSTSPGDIVYFGAGTYNEAVEPSVDGTSVSPIQFIADTDGSMTGDAGSVILDGNNGKDDSNPMKIDKDDYLHFIGIEFVGNSKEGVKVKDVDGVQFTRCQIRNSSDGIKIEGDSEVTLTNCLVVDNAKNGILTKSAKNFDVTVLHCTIANNGEDGIAQEDGDLILTNSIIYGSGKRGLNADGADNTTNTYNLLYNNDDGNYNKISQGTGEIHLDPLFESGSYYQLQIGSPARDAGTSSGTLPTDDFEGNARPADGGYDIGCYERELGLVGYWALDEATGTTADDASSEANDGTLSGTNFASSSETVCVTDSTGLRLNGATDYVTIANDSSLQFTDELTITAWVRADSFGSGTDVDSIVRKGTTNPLDYALVIHDGKVGLVLDDNDSASFTGDTVLAVDRWYHVAATWDGSEAKIYVDGVLDNSTTHNHSSTLGTDSRALNLGGHSAGNLFDGTIDEVQVFKVALPASYISSLAGLAAYYKLDESAGSTAADVSGYGNDGTLIDSPTWRSSGGQIDGALEFFGGESVDIPDPGVGTGPFTVAAWINSDDLSDYDKDYGAGIARSTHSDSIGDWMVSVDDDGAVRFYYWQSAGSDGDGVMRTADGTITSGSWYHVAVTWDGTNQRIYVNGAQEASAGTSKTDSGWGDANEIGQVWPEGAYQFDGHIDEVKILGRAICDDEVQDLYRDGSPGGIRVLKWLEQAN